MMSIITLTRKRPDLYKRLNLSALTLAEKPDALEFIIYRDDDDLSNYEYFGFYTEIIGERASLSEMANACYEKAKYDIIFAIPDDFCIYTRGWDSEVYNAFNKYLDKIVLVYPNSELKPGRWSGPNFGNVSWLHRNWINVVGYFVPPTTCIDEWWNDIANELNRKHYLEDVIIKPDFIGDETHIELNRIRYIEKKEQLYRRQAIERENSVKKLQEFIDNYGTS